MPCRGLLILAIERAVWLCVQHQMRKRGARDDAELWLLCDKGQQTCNIPSPKYWSDVDRSLSDRVDGVASLLQAWQNKYGLDSVQAMYTLCGQPDPCTSNKICQN